MEQTSRNLAFVAAAVCLLGVVTAQNVSDIPFKLCTSADGGCSTNFQVLFMDTRDKVAACYAFQKEVSTSTGSKATCLNGQPEWCENASEDIDLEDDYSGDISTYTFSMCFPTSGSNQYGGSFREYIKKYGTTTDTCDANAFYMAWTTEAELVDRYSQIWNDLSEPCQTYFTPLYPSVTLVSTYKSYVNKVGEICAAAVGGCDAANTLALTCDKDVTDVNKMCKTSSGTLAGAGAATLLATLMLVGSMLW